MLPLSMEGLPPASSSVTKFRMQSMAATRSMLAQAVQFRTDQRYATDWKRWMWFILLWMGDDSLESCFMVNLDERWRVETTLNYIQQCFYVRGLRASTVMGSLSHISPL